MLNKVSLSLPLRCQNRSFRSGCDAGFSRHGCRPGIRPILERVRGSQSDLHHRTQSVATGVDERQLAGRLSSKGTLKWLSGFTYQGKIFNGCDPGLLHHYGLRHRWGVSNIAPHRGHEVAPLWRMDGQGGIASRKIRRFSGELSAQNGRFEYREDRTGVQVEPLKMRSKAE